MTRRSTVTPSDVGPQRPVTSSKPPLATGRVRSSPTRLTQCTVTHCLLYALPHQQDRTHSSSVRSLCEIMSFLYRALVAPSDCPHSTGGHSAGGVPNPSCLGFIAKLIHINSNFISFVIVPTPPCVCVLAFSQSFSKGLTTQLATPLNPSDDA